MDKYSNRYPDGTPYNKGKKTEGTLTYPSADIIDPLLPLPRNYKVSIESTIGIYGTGMLDAIPDSSIIEEYNRQQSLTGPIKGTHGKWIYDQKSGKKRLGKFTWHCSRATLDDGPGSNGIYNTTNVSRFDRQNLYGTKEWINNVDIKISILIAFMGIILGYILIDSNIDFIERIITTINNNSISFSKIAKGLLVLLLYINTIFSIIKLLYALKGKINIKEFNESGVTLNSLIFYGSIAKYNYEEFNKKVKKQTKQSY